MKSFVGNWNQGKIMQIIGKIRFSDPLALMKSGGERSLQTFPC